MTIDWRTIKPLNGSQNNAFEELICQLARDEPIANKTEFYRVAAPDGGVEAYCVSANGEEYGWQAKFFSSMGNSQWSQLKDSLETTLRTHPNLTKYYICIPLDRQDPRINNQSWFMDKWNEKTQQWADVAKKLGRNVTFEYWGSSELIHRLSQKKHAGRCLFWFSKEEFTDDWFQSHNKNSVYSLGNRYTPELNFELDIAKKFDSLSRNTEFTNHFKTELHNFLKQFKRLDAEFLNQDSVVKFKNILNSQFSLCQKIELPKFDIQAILDGCTSVNSSLYEYQNNLQSRGKELTNDSIQSTNHFIYEAYSALYQFQQFISSQLFALTNTPALLLSGEAGIGKSHLLADIVEKRIKQNKACILLLGQHFTSEDPPWTQILKNLLRLNCNEQEFLGALNAKAEAQGERLLFIVDAINEGRGRHFWKNHIRAFIKQFESYPWLALVLSIRSSYEPLLTSNEIIPDGEIIRVMHYGFEGVEYQASSFYFSQHGIEQPSSPLLHPEFRNPLFLKLFCDGLKRSNQKRIPKGYGGITSIVDFFLANVDEKLSEPTLYDYQPAMGKGLVQKVVNALVRYKLEGNLDHIPYDVAVGIANDIVSKFSNKKGFIDALISEGVLSKNIYWDQQENEEGVYFAYERFEDHLTANYLLDVHVDNNKPESAFQNDGALVKYFNSDYLYQGIVEALSIQLPETIDSELYELVDEKYKTNSAIVEAFIQSLLWRKPDTIKQKTKAYVEQNILSNADTFDLFFQMLYSVATDPEHLYNADNLHSYLMQFSMADRDANWTTYLHDKDEDTSAMQRLIEWASQDDNKEYLSDDSRLLACKGLAWLCTSTNISFRDAATKGLVGLLQDKLPVITRLLNDFNAVDDPYVYERILAAAYGAVLRSVELNELDQLAKFILEAIFQQEEVYPNVFVRDYARNIIEYAVYKKIFFLENPQLIRPPYKSHFPANLPSNDEIDAYKHDYKSSDFKVYWGQNAILNSMVTEYGRGMCRYGDFGRYTFQSRLSDWAYKFDPNDLSNYACKLIFDKYGYDIKKHGEFDNYASNGDRHTNKKERIGKKYQWLALYEVLARLSDNFKMQDRSIGWGKDQTYVWYQGTWEPFVRNIDPTFVYHPDKTSLQNTNQSWLNKVEYADWHGSHQDWLVNLKSLPKAHDIIALKDTHGNEWLILDTNLSWNEPVPVGYEEYEYPHKHLRYEIQSYFVSVEQADEVIEWTRSQGVGQWLPNNSDQYQVFSREYYWSPAYAFFDNPYYGRSLWDEVYNEKNKKETIVGKVMITSESHRWESGTGKDQPSYLAPREYMFKKMGLEYSNVIGRWLNSKGELVCFDPSINSSGNASLLIRKDALLQFLDDNKLKIFWTIQGDKSIHGTMFERTEVKKWLELTGVFTLVGANLTGDITPIIHHI